MKIILNPDFDQHAPEGEMHQGKWVPSFENPARLHHIITCFQDHNFGTFTDPQDFGFDPILKIHPQPYVTFLRSIWEEWSAAGHEGDILPYVWPAPGLMSNSLVSPALGAASGLAQSPAALTAKIGSYAFSSDTPIMKDSWTAIYQGAQTALSAVADIAVNRDGRVGQQNRAAFALTRPPGHHAHAACYGGYCFLNNAAIAAQAARDRGYQKICILDVDYHHGNGTQDIFYDRSDVLTISLHGHPRSNFPYYLGFENETGKGAGAGYNLNLPLADGSDFQRWSLAFETARVKIQSYQPDFLIIPLGVDTYEGDPISKFTLKSDDFLKMGTLIAGCVARDIPTLFVMEGGYDIAPIGQNVLNVLQGFEG